MLLSMTFMLFFVTNMGSGYDMISTASKAGLSYKMTTPIPSN